MGQSLLLALRESRDLSLCGGVASSGSARLGEDAAAQGPATGINVTADATAALAQATVAVDFGAGEAVASHAEACAAARVALLVGTTGLDDATLQTLADAARTIPVLIAPNTSLAVGAMTQLVALAARALGAAYDVEIAEAHHRLKRDAPSGTALALGETVARARAVSLSDVAVYGRFGRDAIRAPGSIGFSVARAGDIVGEHTVTFATAGERLEITHRASDRMTFARGALRAAAWLADQSAGLYDMRDVLRL